MLLSCISKWNTCDLGKLLIDFLFYFGFYYDYGIELRKEGKDNIEDYYMMLSIIDPLNPSNNLGIYYNIQQTMCELVIYNECFVEPI